MKQIGMRMYNIEHNYHCEHIQGDIEAKTAND